MNKNKKLNLLFYILTILYVILIVVNLIFNLISTNILFCIGCAIFSIYLFCKFLAYLSDSSLFLSTLLFFIGFFYYFSFTNNFNTFQTLSFIYLAFVLGFLSLFVYFKSSTFLFIFINCFLPFFPIILFSFNLINWLYFFIFLISCVIINMFLYFLYFKTE